MAGNDQIRSYSVFIGALARKFTSSPEEADAAKAEIYADILRYARIADTDLSPREKIASLIARRRLFKYLRDH